MWLLQAATATLTHFADTSAVPGGYAILSHTWDPLGEQSFREVREITRRCRAEGLDARDHLSAKVRDCCIQAEKDGYEWVWIDTCCIDKDSSTELSEAINSMFIWYLHAEVCYAHLSDVPSGERARDWLPAFCRARWHRRGWTLQELLAPALVVFFSSDWKRLGTKNELADHLTGITSIPSSILTRQIPFSNIPVATRMTWAAQRTTTRLEDEAYCLLGLFDIHMPTLYGEDTTLFAWGDRHSAERSKSLVFDEAESSCIDGISEDTSKHFLFAPSPRNFRYALLARMFYTPRLSASAALQPYTAVQCKRRKDGQTRKAVGPFGPGYDLPTFETTNIGMKCRLPLAEIGNHTIAVLFCETDEEHVGLLLHPVAPDPERSHQTYHVGARFEDRSEGTTRYIRVVHLGADFHNLSFRGTTFRASWREFYIATAPPVAPARSVLTLVPDSVPGTPFRVPRWLYRLFTGLRLRPGSGITSSAAGLPVQVVMFANMNNVVGETIVLVLGLCHRNSLDGRPAHWATVQVSGTGPRIDVSEDGATRTRLKTAMADILERSKAGFRGWWSPSRCQHGTIESAAEPSVHTSTPIPRFPRSAHPAPHSHRGSPRIEAHVCPDDHVDFWPGWTRDFGAPARTVRLSFARCPHEPHTTRVVHAELRGRAFERLLAEHGGGVSVAVPPRPRLGGGDLRASMRSREEKGGDGAATVLGGDEEDMEEAQSGVEACSVVAAFAETVDEENGSDTVV
ncbi:HET-domain-containing protein [Epithele typhae]|uniref:HET-domain-containing protein n=1 Tax=Epithele typhae TaxID=378194 RepID=UPI0020087CE5|nr:HET-domain-containing protein [Epithele typhae]KAH9943273.1 HET-domain-containing protein [Epithele typhae]